MHVYRVTLQGNVLFSIVFCLMLLGFMSSNAWPGSGSDRFIKDSQGIITDKQTGLQWYTGPIGYRTYGDAKSWVQSLFMGGAYAYT